MPRGRARSPNGLAQAVQMLIQIQASSQAQLRLLGERTLNIEAQFSQVNQRLDRLEADMRLLLQILRDLPEAVKEKMGFLPPKPSATFRKHL